MDLSGFVCSVFSLEAKGTEETKSREGVGKE